MQAKVRSYRRLHPVSPLLRPHSFPFLSETRINWRGESVSAATPSVAGAIDVGSRPQPGRSFHGETADPASKQPEAVESVNHSLLLTCSECIRLRDGEGEVG